MIVGHRVFVMAEKKQLRICIIGAMVAGNKNCEFFVWAEMTLDKRWKPHVRDVSCTALAILGYFVHFLPVSKLHHINSRNSY